MRNSGKIIATLALTVGLVACGESNDPVGIDASASVDAGSGIDGNRQLGSLTPAEQQAFCEFAVAAEGGPNLTFQCEGFTITTPTVADCVAGFADLASCTATVAQGEACVMSIGADPCDPNNTACAPIIACSPGE